VGNTYYLPCETALSNNNHQPLCRGTASAWPCADLRNLLTDSVEEGRDGNQDLSPSMEDGFGRPSVQERDSGRGKHACICSTINLIATIIIVIKY